MGEYEAYVRGLGQPLLAGSWRAVSRSLGSQLCSAHGIVWSLGHFNFKGTCRGPSGGGPYLKALGRPLGGLESPSFEASLDVLLLMSVMTD